MIILKGKFSNGHFISITMAYSKYKSTTETTNTARVSRLLVDPCTDLFRDLLRDHITEINFSGVLRQKKLLLSPILNKAQRDLLYPTKGSFTGTYNDFDLSLLYVLLRNTTGIAPHKKGWAKPPDPSDRSLSANIDRVREIRNTYCGHTARVSLSDSEFQKLWQDLTVIIGELEGSLSGGGTTYTDAANQIEVDTMDPEQEKRYLDVIDTQHQDIEALKERTFKVQEQINGLKSEVKGQVSNVQEQVTDVQEQVTDVQEQVSDVQEQVSDVQEQLTDVQEQVTDVQEQVSDVQEQVSDVQEQLTGVQEQVTDVQEQVTGVQEQVTGIQTTVEKLNKPDAKSPIPPNVRGQYDIDIQEWREEDKLYCETHSFPSMMQKVRNQPYVTFVGVPGSGKTATVHHIALKLQEEGYEVVPTKDVRKMEDYGDPKNPQVFVIDDVVGVFGLQKNTLDVMTNYEQKIKQPCMIKSRTLMTCREIVFNETLPYKTFLSKEETVVKLHSSDNTLNDTDKKQILQKYGLNVDLISPALLTSTSHMFPLLCRLYSKDTQLQALGSKFFLYPVQCIIKELHKMQNNHKLNYTTLALCMQNENSLSKDILKDGENEKFLKMKIDTLENCQLEHSTDTFKFMNALSAMEGTYTKQCGAQYTFIHDSMFEICAYQYGKQFPDEMLLYMSSSYIANYVKPQSSEEDIVNKVKEKQGDSQSVEKGESINDSEGLKKESDDKNNEREESFDLCIRLREDQYPLLAERLYRDIQNMELYDVFRNQVLKHPQVCQAFIGVLETKSYAEVKNLFLSTKENVDKMVSKQTCVMKESREWGEWRRQNILVDRKYKRDNKTKILNESLMYNIRVISWVISYGHPQILQYLVQQTEQHNEINELFRITGNPLHGSESIMLVNDKRDQKERDIVRSQGRGVFLEQHRLLVLSCYSGDVQTVKIVLFHVCRKLINGLDKVHGGMFARSPSDFPLIVACEEGHVSIVKELVKAGADVNLRDFRGNTPLKAASEEGHVSIVKELVKKGADVNMQNESGDTPLVIACRKGHVSIVKELVKTRAGVNLQDYRGNTPLINAYKKGHVRIVEELVKAGADVNVKDEMENTPLITACVYGHANIVEELVRAGAGVNVQDYRGDAPLKIAYKKGHVRIVEVLVKAGAEVNVKDEMGNTPLITACLYGHVNIVKELVKAGADVNVEDEMGYTPLLTACIFGCVNVNGEIYHCWWPSPFMWNAPLRNECCYGHVNIVEELVRAGVCVNLRDYRGDTSLVTTREKGHVNIVKELVKAGAIVNVKDDMDNTPLLIASVCGHVNIVKELVRAGADVNIGNSHGITPLKIACRHGYVRIVKELVRAGADVNIGNSHGITPLKIACRNGHVRVVKELVKAGAVGNVKDEMGIHHW
ncbi:uncharacterized protein LOC125665455 [Ostrea edulis]|uniref:uncharacterized protein LOC125665455 n=1 Tax=Ostrea edulis TaxID=37623 RepID=UPI0024AF225C|nr:uncharacterized protein LOC125665455 [Ostrea edulis]